MESSVWTENFESCKILELQPISEKMVIQQKVLAKDIFFRFMNDEIIQEIVNHTNEYVCYKKRNFEVKENSHLNIWKELSIDEFKVFLGIIFYADLLNLPHITDHWSNKDFKGSKAREFMSINRFYDILFYFHVSKYYDLEEIEESESLESIETFFYNKIDNEDQVKKLLNSILKIEDIFKKIQVNWRNNYQLNREIAIDERTIAFKGRSNFVLYNPMKPVQYGFRSYVLADSKSGYTWKMKIHANYDRKFRKKAKGNDNSKRIVLELIEELNKGHIIFSDSYYTSIELARELDLKGFGLCASIGKNRKDLPIYDHDSLTWHERKTYKMSLQNSDLSLVIWKDNKVVQLITNVYDPKSLDFKNRNSHRSDEVITIKIPTPIMKYNEFMGGVDLSDQFCAYVETGRKSLKWWKKLFFHILNVCVINSWIIYKSYGYEIKLKDFKFQLSTELLCQSFRMKKISVGIIKEDRHFPGRRGTRKCNYKYCEKKTIFFCKSCGVSLCAAPCFEYFHING